MNILFCTFNTKDFLLQYLPATITWIGTLITAVFTVYVFYDKNRHNHIYLKWVDLVQGVPGKDQLNVAFIISNPASKDSTITRIRLLSQNDFQDCSPYPTRLASRDIKNKEKVIYSDVTPILISARKATQIIVSFTYLKVNPIENKQNLNFEFTINDKVFNKTFTDYTILSTGRFVDALEKRFNQNAEKSD